MEINNYQNEACFKEMEINDHQNKACLMEMEISDPQNEACFKEMKINDHQNEACFNENGDQWLPELDRFPGIWWSLITKINFVCW